MIPYSRQSIDQSDIDAVVETLKGDFLTGGKKVSDFEEALANYLGVKHVCVMNSATSALHVAYQIIGLKKGDEVITTPPHLCRHFKYRHPMRRNPCILRYSLRWKYR